MNFKTNKINKTFIGFVISYVLIVIISILIGSFSYALVYQALKSNTMERGLEMIKKGKEVIDSHLIDIENRVMQLDMDEDLVAVRNIGATLENNEYYSLRKLQNKLISYNLTNKFINDFFVYLKDSKILVSPFKIVARDMDEYYRESFSYEGYNYNDWHKRITEKYYCRGYLSQNYINSGNLYTPVITYLQSFPVGFYSNYKGTFIVTINKESISKLLDINDSETDSWIYICDNNDSVILSDNITEQEISKVQVDMAGKDGYCDWVVNGKKMVIIYSKSEYNGWKYVIGLPVSFFGSKLESIRKMFFLTAAALVVIGILAALYFAHRNNKPIKKILNTALRMKDININHVENEYDFIEGTISGLIQNNGELRDELEKQKPVLKAICWERLLKGSFNSMNEIRLAMKYMDLQITGDNFIVINMRISGFESDFSGDSLSEIAGARVIADNVISGEMGGNCKLINIDNDKTAILLFVKNELNNEYDGWLNEILSRCIDKLYIKSECFLV